MNTLIIGASENPERYSYKSIKMLREYDHQVIAIGKKIGKVEDVNIELKIPKNIEIDTVTLYINQIFQKEFYADLIALKPRRIIFNPGTENKEFYQILQQQGINYLEACTLVLLRSNQF